MEPIKFKLFHSELDCPIWVELDKESNNIDFSYGGPTDEGYSYTGEVYSLHFDEEWQVSYLTAELTTNARDCDGQMSTGVDLIWYESDGLNERGYPNWSRQDSYQRDHTAEAAGY